MPSTLVAVVDDHEVVREGIRLVSMTSQADVKLVGSASTVPGLIDQLGRDPENAALTAPGAKRIECDVVLLDLSLTDRSRPSENVERLREAGMKVLIFSIGENAALIREALRAGALGLVRKSEPLEHAIEEARDIADGHQAVRREDQHRPDPREVRAHRPSCPHQDRSAHPRDRGRTGGARGRCEQRRDPPLSSPLVLLTGDDAHP